MKILRNTVIGLFSVFLVLIGMVVYSFSRTLPIRDFQQLSGGAVQVKDGMVSVGIIPTSAGQVMLVDCGNDARAKAILEGLKKMGVGVEGVKAILITHGHSDHIGGCKDFPNAEIFAMAAEESFLEGKTAPSSPIGHLMGKKDSGLHIARYLQDGDTFQVGIVTVTSYLIPGHTDGSAAYLVAGTLYMGDSADAGKDGKLLPSKRFLSNDTEQNRESLEKLADRLKPKAGEIQFMEFAHSGSVAGIGPLIEFAEKRKEKSAGR